jgi:hypothetical protein
MTIEGSLRVHSSKSIDNHLVYSYYLHSIIIRESATIRMLALVEKYDEKDLYRKQFQIGEVKACK